MECLVLYVRRSLYVGFEDLAGKYKMILVLWHLMQCGLVDTVFSDTYTPHNLHAISLLPVYKTTQQRIIRKQR